MASGQTSWSWNYLHESWHTEDEQLDDLKMFFE